MADPKWETNMLPVYASLTQGLKVSGRLLDLLIQRGLLDLDERSGVDNVQPDTEENKVRYLLNTLRKKPRGSFEKFCTVLHLKEIGYKNLADLLRSGGKKGLSKQEGKAEKTKSAIQSPGGSLAPTKEIKKDGTSRQTVPSKRAASLTSEGGSSAKKSKKEDPTERQTKLAVRSPAHLPKLKGSKKSGPEQREKPSKRAGSSSSKGVNPTKKSKKEVSDSKQLPPRPESCSTSAGSSGTQSTNTAGELNEDAELTPEQMVRLATAVGSKWHQIGVHLKFTFEELDDIDQQKKSNYKRLLQILRKWKDKEEKGAKVSVFMDACRVAKVAAAAKKALLDL